MHHHIRIRENWAANKTRLLLSGIVCLCWNERAKRASESWSSSRHERPASQQSQKVCATARLSPVLYSHTHYIILTRSFSLDTSLYHYLCLGLDDDDDDTLSKYSREQETWNISYFRAQLKILSVEALKLNWVYCLMFIQKSNVGSNNGKNYKTIFKWSTKKSIENMYLAATIRWVLRNKKMLSYLSIWIECDHETFRFDNISSLPCT